MHAILVSITRSTILITLLNLQRAAQNQVTSLPPSSSGRTTAPLPSMSAEMTMASSSVNLPAAQASSSDPFIANTDIHSRQESADSGLGLGSNYTHPHTPEDFLASMEDVEISSSEGKQSRPCSYTRMYIFTFGY